MTSLGRAVLSLVVDRAGLDKGLSDAETVSQRKVQAIGKRLSVSVTPAILGIGAAVLKATDTIQQAMATIRTGTGATGDALEGLRGDFNAVFQQVPVDAQTTATAIADLNTTLGLTGEPLRKATVAALELADATGTDTATLINGTARAMAVFGEESADVVPIMDRLFVVSQRTGVPIGNLTNQLQTYGPVLRNAGFATNEAAAFLGNLHRAGVDASRVFPGLNAFLRRTAEEGVTDLKGALLEVVDAVEAATTDAEALNVATTAFGAEGAQRMSVAIRNGTFEMDALIAAMGEADGAIADNAESTRTLSDRLTVWRNRLTSALGTFDKFPPALQDATLAMGGLLAATGPLLIVLPQMVRSFQLARTALIGLRVSMAAAFGPVGIAVAAIGALAALAAGAVTLQRRMSDVNTVTDEMRQRLSEADRGLLDMRDAGIELSDGLDNRLNRSLEEMRTNAADASAEVAVLTTNLKALSAEQLNQRIEQLNQDIFNATRAIRSEADRIAAQKTIAGLREEIAKTQAQLRDTTAQVEFARAQAKIRNIVRDVTRAQEDNSLSLSDQNALLSVLTDEVNNARAAAGALGETYTVNTDVQALLNRAMGDFGTVTNTASDAQDNLGASTGTTTGAVRKQGDAVQTTTRRIREMSDAIGDIDEAGEFSTGSASVDRVLERFRRSRGLTEEQLAEEQRIKADADHFREGLQQAGDFNTDLIDQDDARTKALLAAQADYYAEAMQARQRGDKEGFDAAVVNAVRIAEELQSIQNAANQERENALFELGDKLVAVETKTGDRLAAELQAGLNELATLEGAAYTARLAELEQFAAANVAVFRQMNIDINNIRANTGSGGGRSSGAGGSSGGGNRRGSGPNFEGRVDPDSVTLGADGRYRDSNGNVVEGNTALSNDDGTFTTEGGQTVFTDSSGNAYFNEGLTQPVSDELQTNIDSQQNGQGLHAGGIALPRMGGVPALLAEAGRPEAVIPLTPQVLAGIGRGIGAASGESGATVVNFYNYGTLTENDATAWVANAIAEGKARGLRDLG